MRSEIVVLTNAAPIPHATEVRYDRNFDTLLYDSIEMLLRSFDWAPSDDFKSTLAHGSTIYSLLMLETAANICLECLDLERAVLDEIDRLPIVAKYDYYLRTKFRKKRLDRGSSVVLGARELKGLRDSVVHLKPHRVEWQVEGEDGTAEPVRTRILKVPKNPHFWHCEDAASTMRGVHDFLRYFFKEKCKYSATKTTSILFSELKRPSGHEYFMPFF